MPDANSNSAESARPFRHASAGEVLRYLLVGAWNSAFGYGTYALFTALFTPHVPYGYVLASLVANLLNITVAFLGYKWFVFRTKGNYLREWIRCVMVYSGVILVGLVLLPPTVFVVTRLTGNPVAAPYVAGIVMVVVSVILGFFGHKNISFRQAIEKP